MRWRRARRWLIVASLLLVGTVSIAVLGATSMMRHSPPWWRKFDAADPRTLASARDVEDGISHLFLLERGARTGPVDGAGLTESGVTISEEWAFAIRASDANAWLNTRLPAWLTRSEDLAAWPEEVRQIQVDFSAGKILLGVELSAGGVVRVLSAEVRPEVREDGSLWLPAESVRIGTLPLPAGLVLSGARSRQDQFVPVSVRQRGENEVLWKALLGEAPVAESPTIRVPDGRRVRIVGLRAQRGVLEVRCRTEWDARRASGAGDAGTELLPLSGPETGAAGRADGGP